METVHLVVIFATTTQLRHHHLLYNFWLIMVPAETGVGCALSFGNEVIDKTFLKKNYKKNKIH